MSSVTRWRAPSVTRTAVNPRPELRVLMVTSEWPMPGFPRTTNFIKRQVDYLRAAGVLVDVFFFHGARNPLRYVSAWARLRPHVRAGGYHLIHAQFGQSGLLALPKQLPLVVTFRGSDLLGIVGDQDGRHTRVGRLLQRASRLVARRADAVILVSSHMREELNTRAPVHVVPSGLDLELFRPQPREEARRRLGFDPDERLVLFVGRRHQARKRFALANRAVELLQERLPARLVVAWGVPHNEIPWYMSACDALVVTSMQEGSPNVVKEALACNLPVVSVQVGDVAERLQNLEGCEVCADDHPETIAQSLERVLLRGQPIDGRSAVRELDERVLTQRVVQIYRSVLPDLPRLVVDD